MEETRVIGREATDDDRQFDQALRPRTLEEYIGQTKVKEKMRIFIRAALDRGEPLDHVLLYGPPGIGKTCLANIISTEMGVNLRVTSGPAIEKPKDLAGLLTNLEAGDVLFIDEIHRLNHTVEEVLYPALEDFALDIMLGMGPSARSIRIDLPHFTVVGATTRAGLLTGPLRDRFGIINRLELYNTDDLQTIVERSAGMLRIPIESVGSREIARRARGTPRIANRLLRRVRDYAQIKGDGVINITTAKGGLEMMEVDELGLDNVDRNILSAIIERFGGGPVGLDTLSASTGEESSTIEDVIEPFLMQLGFLSRTPRGRIATARAFEHMGLKPPQSLNGLAQLTLFEDRENSPDV